MTAWWHLGITVALALLDLRNRRIPNGIVYLWGAVVSVETLIRYGTAAWVYLPMLLLFGALWHRRAWGGGDAKLWSVLWVATPPSRLYPQGLMVLGLCWVLAAPLLLVSTWRGRRWPAAWKAVPYALWLALG